MVKMSMTALEEGREKREKNNSNNKKKNKKDEDSSFEGGVSLEMERNRSLDLCRRWFFFFFFVRTPAVTLTSSLLYFAFLGTWMCLGTFCKDF